LSIDTIVFDFGGVLIDWNPRYLYQKIFKKAEEMEYFLSEICSPYWNEQMDMGRSFREATAELANFHPQYEVEINAYYDGWSEMISGPIKGTPQTLLDLKNEGYNLYGLTNWSAETFPLVFNKYDFFSLFDGIVVSGEEKCIKPDKEIYHILIGRYEIRPEYSIFIDDSILNVDAANLLGFKGINFTNDQMLRKALRGFGLLKNQQH
jgi:2-haloacid dehalogenase